MMQAQQPQSEPIRAVDLFCGAGGLSTALAVACEELNTDVDLVAVNHWDRAIETHEENHPWATHYHSKIEEVDPDAVFPDDHPVDLMVGGPECTHFSTARGGKPVKDQKRMPAWHVLTWVQKLQPRAFIFENVKEFQDWGPIGDDGTPSRNGETFDAWVSSLRSHGYNVSYEVLQAADYGDATSRERLFVIGHRDHQPTHPEPTHSENGVRVGTKGWRTAEEIIDWDDRGQSIWTRGVENSKKPLVANTMRRIAEGLRRHGGPQAQAYADVVESLDPEKVQQLQKVAIPIDDAQSVAEITDEPFFVKYAETSVSLAQPYLLRQQSGGVPPSTHDPVPTISTKGAIAKVEPYLIQYYGQSGAKEVSEPLPTVTTKERFALICPELFPHGIDIYYRMLKPRELADAMGFPTTYEFVGNKTEIVKQIGNAVPVNLGVSLVFNILLENTGQTPDAFADVGTFVADDD